MVRLPTLVVLATFTMLVSGCGWSASSARDAASAKWCEFANRCGDIGSGQRYANLDECMTKQRSAWLDAWPTSRCESHVNAQALDVCLRAIDNTQCGNIIDQVATLSKCGQNDVCR